MRTLELINEGVKRHGKDDGIDLTTADGLLNSNRIVRAMAARLKWPELRRVNTELKTTITASIFNFPKSFFAVNILSVQIQDSEDSNKYKTIHSPITEADWERAELENPATVPQYYQLFGAGDGVIQIEFRSAPKEAKTVRFTGIVEPEFQDKNSTSPFRMDLADDILEMLIAADYLEFEGPNQFSDRLLRRSDLLLQSIFANETIPSEVPSQIIRGDE